MATETDLRPGFFLTGKAWLDNDGRHVWVGHDCMTEHVVTMLPWPNWHSTGLTVEPSVHCEACEFHTVLDLGPPEQEYRCMATWEVGRWCERMADHDGTHRNSMVEWGSYSRGEARKGDQ